MRTIDGQGDQLRVEHALLVATDEVVGLRARVELLESKLARSRARTKRLSARLEALETTSRPERTPGSRLARLLGTSFRGTR